MERSIIDEVAKIAHSIKGSAGTFGLDEFTEPATKLQDLAKERNEQEIERALCYLVELSQNVDLDDQQMLPVGG